METDIGIINSWLSSHIHYTLIATSRVEISPKLENWDSFRKFSKSILCIWFILIRFNTWKLDDKLHKLKSFWTWWQWCQNATLNGVSLESPHKEPVTRKMFPFDDVTMHSSHVYNICSEKIELVRKSIRVCETPCERFSYVTVNCASNASKWCCFKSASHRTSIWLIVKPNRWSPR